MKKVVMQVARKRYEKIENHKNQSIKRMMEDEKDPRSESIKLLEVALDAQ